MDHVNISRLPKFHAKIDVGSYSGHHKLYVYVNDNVPYRVGISNTDA